MTGFRDELRLLAAQAPEVDLAERALRGARRQRSATLGSVVATLVALALSTLVLAGPSGVTTTGRIADVLPVSGVDPAAYAYYDWCGKRWDYRKNTGTFAGEECVQWRLVTRTGQSFRMPEALSVYTDQSPDNYMNTAAPLVISSDGRRVAYYSEKDQRFAVRDLADGRIWLTPQTVPRAAMLKGGGMLQLSPDGRFLGMSGIDVPNAVVDMETGRVTEVPAGWWAHAVGRGGGPIVVRDERDRLGVLDEGKVRVVVKAAGEPRAYGQLSPDGHVMAYLDGAKTDGDNMVTKNYDTVVTVDVTTGEEVHRVRFRDAPKGFKTMRMGGWQSASEVTVSDMVRNDPRRRKIDDVPTLGEVTYGIEVGTGQVRTLTSYTYRAWAGDLSLPGF
ncbi:hypothetical protein [Nonomuraea sp. NPDC002799]